MQKLILFLLIILYSTLINGQRLNGYVVTNVNDTIKCDFLVQTNMFNQKIFYATSVYKSVSISNEKGQKITYYPKDLISFYIKNTSEGDMKFVSLKEDYYKYFYHEFIKDRISVYKLYNKPSPYNGAPNSNYKQFLYKNGKFVELKRKNTRANIAEMVIDNKEIYDKWMDVNGYYKLRDASNIINQYNNWYKGIYSVH